VALPTVRSSTEAMDVDVRGVAIGFTAAAVILVGLVWIVGPEGVAAAFGMLGPVDILLLTLATAGYLLAWSLALRTVLAALDIEATFVDATLLFCSATFANNITPFGQAGGEPFSALLVARATDSEYESALAAVASVDTINFIPSILLAGIGLAYYIAIVAVGNEVIVVTAVVVGLAVGVPTLGYALWRLRSRVQRLTVSVLHPVTSTVGRVIPSLGVPTKESVTRRVRGFFRAIERVADSRITLLEALIFSTVGWLCLSSALWLALAAVGHSVPVAAALIAAPVGAIASVTPLPGGLGGVELAIVLLVVPITAVGADVAASAALVYRGATYWLPTVVGGLASAWLEGRARP
jgi:uncharacterized protein (TIRG00374 family)